MHLCMNNWSDYPIFLAVAETGSLTAAGEMLGISQPTVGRRIKALEMQFGAPILTKDDGKLIPTEFGYLVLDHIKRMGEEADAITRSSATLEDSLEGTIMLAASEGIGDFWLPSVMKIFREEHPEVAIDINVDFKAANLAQREADIALRWMGPGSQNSLIGRKVSSSGFGLFASKSYLKKHGKPQTVEDLASHDCVSLHIGKNNFWPLDKKGNPLPMGKAVFCSNNLTAHHHAVQAGYGIGMLSFGVINSDISLVRLFPEIERVEDLWVVAHEDLKKSARVRAAFDFLIDALQRDHAHFRYGEESAFTHLRCQELGLYETRRDSQQETNEKLRTSVA